MKTSKQARDSPKLVSSVLNMIIWVLKMSSHSRNDAKVSGHEESLKLKLKYLSHIADYKSHT
eukprot:scaffold6249_cov119-Skeletonema_dohrnii-CCMP3373.AAC.2